MRRDETMDVIERRIAQSRQRDMRGEFALLGRHAEHLADALMGVLQAPELRTLRDARIERMRLVAAEGVDPLQPQRERPCRYDIECSRDFTG